MCHVLVHVSCAAVRPVFIYPFLFKVNSDGSVVAEKPDSAISEATLLKIQHWKSNGLSMDDIIHQLRKETVPPGYVVHLWNPGTAKPE